MKTSSSYVIVGTYNEKNLFQLFKKINKLGIPIGPGKDILKNRIEWPEMQFPRRSEIFPVSSNSPSKCARIANLFELCAFITHYPAFVCQHGPIEAYDESLESFYKETGIDLSVPVFGLYGNHVMLYLRSRKQAPVANKLAAND